MECSGVLKNLSMMRAILTSDGVIVEERQIVRLKKEIEYLTDELQYGKINSKN